MGQSDFVLSILDRAAAAFPGAVGLYDLGGRHVVPFGHAGSALFGYPAAELAQLEPEALQALVHAEDGARLAALVRRSLALADGESTAEALRVRHADGRWCEVHLQTAVFARAPDERPVVILATATPSADGLAATDGRRARVLLETLLEHVPEGVVVSGAEPELRVLAQSRSARELFGRSLSRVADLPARGRGAQAFGLYEADGEAAAVLEHLPTYRAARFGEVVEGEEWLVRRPDGSWSAVDVQAVPVRAGDTVVGVVSSWRDATVRKQLEDAVREQAEQLALLVRSARIAWWRYELADGTLHLSEECRELLAWPREREITPERFLEAVHPAHRRRAAAVFDGSREVCNRVELELRLVRQDGQERWASLSTDCHSDDFGRPLRLFAVMTDVTEKKRAEAALRESEERFRALARSVGWNGRGRQARGS